MVDMLLEVGISLARILNRAKSFMDICSKPIKNGYKDSSCKIQHASSCFASLNTFLCC